jgi:hypothetical protein
MKNTTMLMSGFAFLIAALFTGYIFVNASEKDVFESSVLASVHLLSLALGLSGVSLRGIYLRMPWCLFSKSGPW